MDAVTAPAGFRHHYALQVRWSDMDALGHVNNAKFLTYMEQARWNYVDGLKMHDDRPGRLGMILAKVTLDFKLPLFSSDDVHVFTRCTRLGKSSIDMEHWIGRVKDGALEIAAQAAITVVVYDYGANRSAPIPDEWRSRLKAYEVAAL